jgi:predicted XRE-type DNA-binding protein
MCKIADVVKPTSLKQEQAADLCGTTQPRLNDLLKGKVARFSLGALVNIGAPFGVVIQIIAPRAAE